MNTIGSCPQLTLTLESNWGGHRMHISNFAQLSMEAMFNFLHSIGTKMHLNANNQKHANMQGTNFGDKIQTSHESTHAIYCNKGGIGQSLLRNCLMPGD